MRSIVLVLLLLASGPVCMAQDTVYLTKALRADSVHHYGREALYTDVVARRIYEGAAAPAASAGWKAVEADSLHQFRSRGFGSSSYLYMAYQSSRAVAALLHVKGSGGIFFNGEPHAGDAYGSGWMYIPVMLRKGLNEIYIRPSGITTVRLVFSGPGLRLLAEDATLPSLRIGERDTAQWGAVVVINRTERVLRGASIRAEMEGRTIMTALPEVPAFSMRKVPFRIDGDGVKSKGRYSCRLLLSDGKRSVDSEHVVIEAVEPGQRYNTTFFSHIDGSLQYYSVTPQSPAPVEGASLFLSVHGAGVEASGQAAAYEPKTWGTLVAATNRRPRGFNWEDWGRLDALEVLDLAKARYKPEPHHIYLTGHSMGGHGSWYLGVTYPDRWAAIAPCSGYPTLREYGSHDGMIPDSGRTDMERQLLRASNASDVLKLASNYRPLGIYILHGDADPVVSVKYARQMRQLLGTFHSDLSYYEYPGGEHWFGNQSVDWKPLFQFFEWHRLAADSAVRNIDFMTANPGISASYRWATIAQQERPLVYSRIVLQRDLRVASITGRTENVGVLALDLGGFGGGQRISLRLDSLASLSYTTQSASDTVYLYRHGDGWQIGARPGMDQKNPARYGTFKEAFDHRMVFVYGTGGNKEEQAWSLAKARYDAETWYYRGNGAVDIIADREYAADRYTGRSVILYGNSVTNSAWGLLLRDCPIQVGANELRAGDKIFKGDDLAAYFIRPLAGSNVSVAVVTGTGLKGMRAANANQYFAGGSGFPDYMIFRLGMLEKGASEVLMAGFFDNAWKLTK